MYGVSAWECRLTQFFNHILTDWEDQTWSCARKKSRKRRLQGESYSITKEKIRVKKETGCPLKLFLEGNRGIFTVILFSKDSDPTFKKCLYNLKAAVSKANLKPLTLLWWTLESKETQENPILACLPLLITRPSACVLLAGWLTASSSRCVSEAALELSLVSVEGALPSCRAQEPPCQGFSRCRAQAPGHGRGICGPGA